MNRRAFLKQAAGAGAALAGSIHFASGASSAKPALFAVQDALEKNIAEDEKWR